ncbi:hypothetical protein Tco_0649334, partial [Tanacetum coccineum]
RDDDGDDVTMMVLMTVGVWWGDSEVVVMERMSGGAWKTFPAMVTVAG